MKLEMELTKQELLDLCNDLNYARGQSHEGLSESTERLLVVVMELKNNAI